MLTIIEKANPYTQTVNAVINEYTNELTKIKTKIESTTNTIQQQAVATLNKIEQMPAAETFDLASLQQQITSLQDILYQPLKKELTTSLDILNELNCKLKNLLIQLNLKCYCIKKNTAINIVIVIATLSILSIIFIFILASDDMKGWIRGCSGVALCPALTHISTALIQKIFNPDADIIKINEFIEDIMNFENSLHKQLRELPIPASSSSISHNIAPSSPIPDLPRADPSFSTNQVDIDDLKSPQQLQKRRYRTLTNITCVFSAHQIKTAAIKHRITKLEDRISEDTSKARTTPELKPKQKENVGEPLETPFDLTAPPSTSSSHNSSLHIGS